MLMNQGDGPEQSPFNPPEVAGERFAYLVCLLGIAVGPLGLLIGALGGQRPPIVVGLITLLIAGVCRIWLQREKRFAAASEALEAIVGGGEAHSPERVAHLVSLLKQWDELELKRGSPEFDPWAVQALRHDIRAAIQENPALERLFQV